MQKARRSGRAAGASWGAAGGQLGPRGAGEESRGVAGGRGALRRVVSKGEGAAGVQRGQRLLGCRRCVRDAG